MGEVFNIYCDESCHLENDGIPVMVLGAVWCKAELARSISERIREIKARHGISPRLEVKWAKVSPAKLAFYLDLIDYFFDDDDLHFRGLLIQDKTKLDHAKFGQNHDDWYYKMFFRTLEPIIDPTQSYNVYLDIKDTRSEHKRANLEQILRRSRHDHTERIIRKVQQIRSHESELMQLADLLIGVVSYRNRRLQTSEAKGAVVQRVQRRSGKRLEWSTWLLEPKFNLFLWQAQEG